MRLFLCLVFLVVVISLLDDVIEVNDENDDKDVSDKLRLSSSVSKSSDELNDDMELFSSKSARVSDDKLLLADEG